MNTLQAMEDTLALARERDLDNVEADIEAATYPHLLDMFNRASSGEFSEGKINRWLGWMQGCVYCMAAGEITLDELKEINKRNA